VRWLWGGESGAPVHLPPNPDSPLHATHQSPQPQPQPPNPNPPTPTPTTQVIYDCGPVATHQWEDFDAVRARLAAEWAALPPTADVVSAPLRAKMDARLLGKR